MFGRRFNKTLAHSRASRPAFIPNLYPFIRPSQWDSEEIFQWLFFPTKYFFLAVCSLTRTVCSYSIEYSKFPDATVVKQELPLLCLLCAAGWD